MRAHRKGACGRQGAERALPAVAWGTDVRSQGVQGSPP